MFGIVYQVLLISVAYTLSSFKRSLLGENFNKFLLVYKSFVVYEVT